MTIGIQTHAGRQTAIGRTPAQRRGATLGRQCGVDCLADRGGYGLIHGDNRRRIHRQGQGYGTTSAIFGAQGCRQAEWSRTGWGSAEGAVSPQGHREGGGG